MGNQIPDLPGSARINSAEVGLGDLRFALEEVKRGDVQSLPRKHRVSPIPGEDDTLSMGGIGNPQHWR